MGIVFHSYEFLAYFSATFNAENVHSEMVETINVHYSGYHQCTICIYISTHLSLPSDPKCETTIC